MRSNSDVIIELAKGKITPICCSESVLIKGGVLTGKTQIAYNILKGFSCMNKRVGFLTDTESHGEVENFTEFWETLVEARDGRIDVKQPTFFDYTFLDTFETGKVLLELDCLFVNLTLLEASSRSKEEFLKQVKNLTALKQVHGIVVVGVKGENSAEQSQCNSKLDFFDRVFKMTLDSGIYKLAEISDNTKLCEVEIGLKL